MGNRCQHALLQGPQPRCDILPFLAASTGYDNFIAQTGNVQNQGVELALGYNNTWGDFTWDSGFTLTFNENKIVELANDIVNPITGENVTITEIQKDWLGGENVAPRVILRQGGSLTDIYVNNFIKRDLNGYVDVDANGRISMERTDFVKVGQLAPKANLGWSNASYILPPRVSLTSMVHLKRLPR